MYIAHYKQFIVADATRKKNIKIPNKVTEVIYCHCKAAASIMRATVLVLSVYTRITIWISARQIGQPVPLLTRVSTQVAQNRAWPQGTSATPSRCTIRHTSQQLSAGAGGAGDVEVVAVAAAGDAVAAGWSSASSSSLMDVSWRGCRALVCAPTL